MRDGILIFNISRFLLITFNAVLRFCLFYVCSEICSKKATWHFANIFKSPQGLLLTNCKTIPKRYLTPNMPNA
jgi:hypothetical protein